MELLKSNLVKSALENGVMVKALMSTVPRLDRQLMKVSRGWLNVGFQTVALIETIGARSGARREIVTLCMPAGNALVLVGSNWGRDTHPAWYFNLQAHPLVQVAYRGYRGPMKAREISGAERKRLWELLVEYNPQYARYQEGTSRRLPVIMLTRHSGAIGNESTGAYS